MIQVPMIIQQAEGWLKENLTAKFAKECAKDAKAQCSCRYGSRRYVHRRLWHNLGYSSCASFSGTCSAAFIADAPIAASTSWYFGGLY